MRTSTAWFILFWSFIPMLIIPNLIVGQIPFPYFLFLNYCQCCAGAFTLYAQREWMKLENEKP